ncbi:MAG: hypothetical protein KAI47_23180 [Deltaproteobacteria bacterium]|nr:hypothetical protein [Deltaproteobacteria bacterium]
MDRLDAFTDQLYGAYHARWVQGDMAAARRRLRALIAAAGAPSILRAQAALWLGEIAELQGARRAALGHLEAFKRLAGPATALARLADDRRARIVTRTPLADVRGPVPGSLRLSGSPQVSALFRRAEQRLVALHRVVVRPRIENIDAIRRGKKTALRRAVALYEAVAQRGDNAAKAAARFRIAAMYHHMAEALAFERPPELLQKFARKLARQAQAQSLAYLSLALTSYRAAANVPAGPGTEPWRGLARREAKTLAHLIP